MQSADSRRPRWPKSPLMPSSLVGRRAGDTASEHRDQPIDRDHQHGLLNPLDATRANHAHDRHGAAPTPTPTPPRQPRSLLAHPSEMAIVIRPRLGLDHERDAGRRDCQRVDAPAPAPGQRMTQPPPVRPKWCKCALDLVLRASTNAAALGERQPVASVEPEPDGEEENGAGRGYRPRAREGQREQHARTARDRCRNGS
jgi:hypothetical protein